jgi:thioredoxin-like negative regulator of GroEL
MANIKEIKSLEEYNDFINRPNTLNIIKIGSSWCGPCRTLEQTIAGLTNDEVEGVLLAEIDADEEWAEDTLAGLKVRGIPVMIAFWDGTEKDRVQGGLGKADLISFIEKNK